MASSRFWRHRRYRRPRRYWRARPSTPHVTTSISFESIRSVFWIDPPPMKYVRVVRSIIALSKMYVSNALTSPPHVNFLLGIVLSFFIRFSPFVTRPRRTVGRRSTFTRKSMGGDPRSSSRDHDRGKYSADTIPWDGCPRTITATATRRSYGSERAGVGRSRGARYSRAGMRRYSTMPPAGRISARPTCASDRRARRYWVDSPDRMRRIPSRSRGI